MTDKKKIAIVGVGSSYIQTAIAAFKDSHPEVVIVEATDKMKEAIEGIKQATIASESLNKALAELKKLEPKLLACKETPSSNKPFYHNVPKYRRKRRW